jgi:hypothetical protein
MKHLRRIVVSMALVAILATPAPTAANVGPVLDKQIFLTVIANNAPALRIIGGCTSDNCP